MEKITYLAKQLKNRAATYPHLTSLTLTQGELFSWNHTACAITYDVRSQNAAASLLHEFGHAALNHRDYSRDIDLLKLERAAWDAAQMLAKEYDVVIDEGLIESSLDTYRDWLHQRSQCPQCQATGIQTHNNTYTCPACKSSWAVNQARQCALRRYTKKRP